MLIMRDLILQISESVCKCFMSVEKSYLNQCKFMLLQMKYWCLVNLKSANTHSESEPV